MRSLRILRKAGLFLVLLAAMALLPAMAFADTYYDEEISVGDVKSITVSNDSALGYTQYEYKFVPAKSGTYRFQAYSTEPEFFTPWCEIYEAENYYKIYTIYDSLYDHGGLFDRVFEAEAGKTYILMVGCATHITDDGHVYSQGKGFNMNVKLTSGGIKSISLQPASPYEVVAGDGYRHNKNSVDYNLPEYQNGDKLTITDTAGVSTTFAYQKHTDPDYDYFVNTEDPSNKINAENVLKYLVNDGSVSYGAQVGAEYPFIIDYKGVECNSKFKTIASDIESIEYTPKYPLECEEGEFGEFRYDKNEERYWWFNYFGDIEEGDILTVKKQGGLPKQYEYGKVDLGDRYHYFFINPSDPEDRIDGDLVRLDDECQEDMHWEIGLRNKIKAVYLDKECDVDITLKENSILAIKFQPVSEYVYTENPDGYYRMPDFQQGDKLTVWYKDGSELDLFYNSDEEAFIDTVNGDKRIRYYDVDVWDDQEHWPWSAGGHYNYLFIQYHGTFTQVPVTVNPVEKKAQSMTLKGSSKTYTVKNLKKGKKSFTAITLKKSVGTLTYNVKGNSKSKKYLSFSKKTKKVTVKKGTPKGKYVLTISVHAAGDKTYKSCLKSTKVTVTVKK